MKKSTHTILRRMANQLPVFKIRSKQGVKYSGEYLRSVNVFEVEGKTVDPDGTYTVYPLSDVNHYVNLKDIYKKEGMTGVEEYCELINKKFGQNIPA